MIIKRTNKLNPGILKAAYMGWFNLTPSSVRAMSPFPKGAGPPALGWWLPPEAQQVEGGEIEGMVPGEGISNRGAVKLQPF